MSHNTAATVAHTIGIDTGKNTLHLSASTRRGQSSCGRDCPRPDHGPARQCAAVPDRNRSWHGDALSGSRAKCVGHDVKQVPHAYAKPFRQGHKNDFRDAHAIAEAVQRPSTRSVPVKTDDQLDHSTAPECDLAWSAHERL